MFMCVFTIAIAVTITMDIDVARSFIDAVSILLNVKIYTTYSSLLLCMTVFVCVCVSQPYIELFMVSKVHALVHCLEESMSRWLDSERYSAVPS